MTAETRRAIRGMMGARSGGLQDLSYGHAETAMLTRFQWRFQGGCWIGAWGLGRRSGLETEFRSHQQRQGLEAKKLDEVTKGAGVAREEVQRLRHSASASELRRRPRKTARHLWSLEAKRRKCSKEERQRPQLDTTKSSRGGSESCPLELATWGSLWS